MIPRMIDAETGMLAGEWCPITQREWFKPGTEPTEVCNEHDELVDPEAGSAFVRIGRWAARSARR